MGLSTSGHFGYLVIEGPIGVGKTTLTRRFASSLGCEPLLEAPMDNPFLPRFYQNPTAWALSTQLSFLLQRSRQIADLNQGDLFRNRCVSDFMLAKDRLFAELNLERDELELYEQVYEHVVGRAPVPDVLIFLQAPVDVLLARIARRGIEYEQSIDPDYLNRLNDAYARFFASYRVPPGQVLAVLDAADVDFADRDDHFELLRHALSQLPPGRHHLDLFAAG